MRRITLPDLLTFNGGYVDAAGFIALHGLFTAHVTGNFVTIGASLVHGASGIVAKLLVLPAFCVAVFLARIADQRLNSVRVMIATMTALLAVAAVLAVAFGPFAIDSAGEIATGMVLVMAMAIQNVVHRVHFPKAPPTTLMTGSTTQAMMDIADLWRRGLAPEAMLATRARCATLARTVGIFAAGCGLAALAYLGFGFKLFLVPPVVAALALLPTLLRQND